MPQHVASFSLLKTNRGFLIDVKKIQGEDDAKLFLFDTGASVSLLGLNSFTGNNKKATGILKTIIENDIITNNVKPYQDVLKSITNDPITVYPCKCDGVFISGTAAITFYFHIYLGNISLPVLGFDYIDDCSFTHGISGGLDITAIANEPGKRFYPKSVIDFNSVIKTYNAQVGLVR